MNYKKILGIFFIFVGLMVVNACHQTPCPGVGGPAPKQSKKVQKMMRKYPVNK